MIEKALVILFFIALVLSGALFLIKLSKREDRIIPDWECIDCKEGVILAMVIDERLKKQIVVDFINKHQGHKILKGGREYAGTEKHGTGTGGKRQ